MNPDHDEALVDVLLSLDTAGALLSFSRTLDRETRQRIINHPRVPDVQRGAIRLAIAFRSEDPRWIDDAVIVDLGDEELPLWTVPSPKPTGVSHVHRRSTVRRTGGRRR